MSTAPKNFFLRYAPHFRKIAAFATMLGILSDAFFFGTVIDDGTQKKEDFFGLSYPAIAAGLFLAAISAWGSAYSHIKRDAHCQNKSTDDSASINGDDFNDITLFWYQKAALIGNTVAEAADVVAPIAFVIKLGTHAMPLSKQNEGILNAGLFLLGISCAVADTTSCYMAMLSLNQIAKTIRETMLLAIETGNINNDIAEPLLIKNSDNDNTVEIQTPTGSPYLSFGH